MLLRTVLLTVGLVLAPTWVTAGETPNVMWRFDGNGRFPNIRPPVEWRSDRNVLWKTSVGIGGYSSPIVVQDKVFVTAEMGSLVCLALADGRILWTKDLFSKDSPDIPADLSRQLMRGCGGESKQSTPTPTSNGELVFYINAMGLCACYDLDEETKAERIEPGVKIDGLARAKYAYASPTAAEGHVFFFDDAGNTAVLELGRQYRPVRINRLDDGLAGTPFFRDDKIVIRGINAVYCIGEKH